jgi:hypothetical protein
VGPFHLPQKSVIVNNSNCKQPSLFIYLIDLNPQTMKSVVIVFFLFFSLFSYAQDANLKGPWFLLDQDESTPLGFNFLENGELIIYEVNPASDLTYQQIEGSYYLETGSNLLVTISWYDQEAITSKYMYSLEDGKLYLRQTYPIQMGMILKREADIVEL